MAQSSNQPRGDGGAEFIRRIVTDPANVPDVMRLYGYLGASSEEGHERLYLSPDLANYVEVPTSAILHRMAVPADQDPHGAVVLWVKRDAALIHKMAPAAQALAHYFAGAIQGAAAAAAGVAAAPAGWAVPPSPFCTPASCNPYVCGHSPPANCTHNILCGKTPVVCTQPPVCPPHHTNPQAACPPISFDCLAQPPQAAAPMLGSYYGLCSPGCGGSWVFCPTQFLYGCAPPQGSVLGCPVSGLACR